MALKFVLLCVAAICLFQFITASPRVARDAEGDDQKDVTDALNAVKNGFDQIVKSLQNNDMLKNLTEMIQNFGEEVADQGKHLVKKIQDNSS